MTREEALEVFSTVKERSEHFKECGCRFPLWTITERDEEALDMAIEALKADVARWSSWNKTFEQSGIADLISREDAIESVAGAIWHYPNQCYKDLNVYEFAEALAKDALSVIPSAEAVHKPDYSYEADMVRRLKESLSADAISHEDTVTLNSPIIIQAEMVAVVRCKDCRHRDLFSCPLADNDFQKDDDFCSWGERREE